MGDVKFIVVAGKSVTIEVQGATNIEAALEQAGIAHSNKDVRVNGAKATAETTVSGGDTVVVAPKPKGA